MSGISLREAARRPEGLAAGHRLCAGCGESLIVRTVLKAARGPTVVSNATGCLEVATSIFPYTSWNVPWIHTAFENAAANASGIEAAYVAMRLSDFLHSLDDITEPDPAYMAMIGFGNNIEFGSSEGRPIFDFKKDEDES